VLINKRKLIQLFLSELHGERQYLEFKRDLDLDGERGRASVVRAVCALANSNRTTCSYLLFGIEDETRAIRGIDPIDDQRFQQLMRNLLCPVPTVLYENIVFPDVSPAVVGLLTIYPNSDEIRISRNIWKLSAGDTFRRNGSETFRGKEVVDLSSGPELELIALEAKAAASLEGTLRDFVQFYSETLADYHPRFVVFHDRHTVCYSGYPETGRIESETWAILAGEGVRLFWGALQYVEFDTTSESFTITEHIPLFWKGERLLVPIERTSFHFLPDGTYCKECKFVFKTVEVPVNEIADLLNVYCNDLEAYRSGAYKSQDAYPRFEIYCHELLVAALNGNARARQYLLNYLDGEVDGIVAEARTEAIRFLGRIEAESVPAG